MPSRRDATSRPVRARMPSDVRRLMVGVAFSALGSGLTLPFLMVYLHEVREMPTAVAGAVMAWLGAVSLLVAPPLGTLVDRLGPRPVLVAASMVEATGVGLLALVTEPLHAFAVATVIAVGGAGTWPAAASMLARMVPEQQRQRVFGLQFVLLNLGIGIGGLVSSAIVDLDSPGRFQVLYLLDAATYLGYVAVLLTLRGAGDLPPTAGDHPDAPAPGGYRVVLADRVFLRVVLMSLAMVTFGYAQIEAGFTAFATQEAEVGPRVLGWAFAGNTAAIVAGQMLVLRHLEGRSRSRALSLVGVLWAASWLLVGAAGPPVSAAVSVTLLVAALVVFGLGETIWSPLAPALVNDLAPEHLRGRYNAVSSMTWQVSNVVGPVFAGVLIGAGRGRLWVTLTAAGCLVAGGSALRLRRRLTERVDRGPVAPEVHLPVATQIDPALVGAGPAEEPTVRG